MMVNFLCQFFALDELLRLACTIIDEFKKLTKGGLREKVRNKKWVEAALLLNKTTQKISYFPLQEAHCAQIIFCVLLKR